MGDVHLCVLYMEELLLEERERIGQIGSRSWGSYGDGGGWNMQTVPSRRLPFSIPVRFFCYLNMNIKF